MGIMKWLKEHPTETIIGLGGIGVLLLLIMRSGGSSNSGVAGSMGQYYQAQLQEASINSQNSQVQAAAAAQENQTNAAAQVQNNTLEAELAATALQYNAGTTTAQLAAQVAEDQTNQQANVETTYINADQAVTQTELGDVTTLNEGQQATQQQYLNDAFQLDQTQQQEVAQESQQILPLLGTGSGDFSQTLLSYLSAIHGSNAGATALASLGQSNNNEQLGAIISGNQLLSNITNTVTNAATGLFA